MSYQHFVETQPSRAQVPAEDTQPIRRRRRFPIGRVLFLLLLSAVLLAGLGLVPGRTNVLLLGIDRAPEGTAAGRSDTLMLFTFQPLRPYAGVLSIPRDLWLPIPGHGSNRINTAHFFAEASEPGSGSKAAAEAVQSNFGVDVDYTFRIQFEGLVDVVDAMGGVVIDLPEATSGYPAGRHRLTGEEALAFVRDRAASDDFGRMKRGQIFLRSMIQTALNPVNWPRWPLVAGRLLAAVDTNVPPWVWPRIVVAFARVGVQGMDTQVLDRGLVVGHTTPDGAQVLLPVWERINPVLLDMFGQ